MNPTPGDVHVNTPLSNISIAFMQKATNFVSDRVFPNIPVGKQSDRYYTYDRGDFNRDEMTERAPGAESEGSGYRLDNTPTYYAPVYAFHKDIPDQVRSNADSVLAPDREATNFVTQKAMIKREKLFVSKFFAGGLWTYDKDGVASGEDNAATFRQWNDTASNPIEDVRRGKRTVLESTGFEPNKMVVGRAVYDALLDHPDIVDRLKYGQTPGAPAKASAAALASLFEVDEICVMNAIENTAKEGQTNSHSFIGGKKALLVYAAPEPGLMTPTAGYTFSWTGHLGAGAMGGRIKSFRMENIASDRVEIEMAFDQKLVSADLGYFFDTIVA
jgi:hypothetical protein